MFLAAILVFSLGLVALDKAVSSSPGKPESADRRFISAGWYCQSPTLPGVEATMTTANPGRRPVTLRRLAIGGSAESEPSEADLRPRRRNFVQLAQLSPSMGLGLAESFGAPVVANVSVLQRDKGVAASECVSEPGSRWLFAAGSTARRQDTYLLVGNPFREEAVIRVKVMDPSRELAPALLKDVVIPPLSQTSLFLAESIQETPSFGLEVNATQGRVVVSRYFQVATREGVDGVSLTGGVQAPGRSWNFAGGRVPAQGEETIVLANPNRKEALVQIIFQTERDQVAPGQLDEIAVPAGQQVRVKTSEFLPRGTEHGTRALSSNGVTFVAERETTAEAGAGRGFETVFGVPAPARRWTVAAGSNVGGSDSLAVVNHGRKAATVNVSLLVDGPEEKPASLREIAVGADRRKTIDLTPYLPAQGATAVVTGSAPITVENLLVVGPPYSDYAASHGEPLG